MNKEEAIKKMINDSAYQSPIEMIYHDMQMHFEDEVCKAVQQVDIHVDKEELIKALQYDREQFAKGYANARAVSMQKQHEEREHMITWLAKFCRHIDMPEHLSDEDAEILWREKMKQQFGWDENMIQIQIERRPDAERMAYMQGYKAGIEKGKKEMLGYYPQTRKWIPCSERLPEEYGVYLVTNEEGSVFEYDYSDLTVHNGKWSFMGINVIAWMPLPEPYREEAIE